MKIGTPGSTVNLGTSQNWDKIFLKKTAVSKHLVSSSFANIYRSVRDSNPRTPAFQPQSPASDTQGKY